MTKFQAKVLLISEYIGKKKTTQAMQCYFLTYLKYNLEVNKKDSAYIVYSRYIDAKQ